MPPERRLAAILFTDMVGSTALMAKSKEVGLRARPKHREFVRAQVEQHSGELGDAIPRCCLFVPSIAFAQVLPPSLLPCESLASHRSYKR